MKNISKVMLLALLSFLAFAGCRKETSNNNDDHSDQITQAYTTLEKTILPIPVPLSSPKLMPYDIALFSQYGYGNWQIGPGLPFVKLSLSSSYDDTGVTNETKLLHYFTMSDVHLTDVQSPAQILIGGLSDSGNSSAYSPVMLYTTQVLNAAVRTVNVLHQKQPMDFGLFLGDANNDAELIELRWYIDIIDGKMIKPNSDPKSSSTTDYMIPFKAPGLDKTIPWYQVLGNHDHFYLGSWPQTPKTENAYIGQNIINVGFANLQANYTQTGFYGGVIDGTTQYGTIIGNGPEGIFSSPPQVNANPDRRPTNITSWISEFFNTSSLPVGHGFNKSNTSFPCYSFQPKSELPIKIIVLDDTESDQGALGAAGCLDPIRYNWLVNELDEGQAAGMLMIVAAHIPLVQSVNGRILWDPSSNPTEEDLITKLHTYPNLMLWMSGHVHRNLITPMPSPDPTHPENGFWLVETASLRDFPQQFRLFDIYRNSDNTISIFTTNVNPIAEPGSPAATSLSYGIAAAQIFLSEADLITPPYAPIGNASGAYNAELVKQLSPAMKAKISKLSTKRTY